MSAFQRTKGAAFEREVSRVLSDAFGIIVQRKLGQARDGGDDIQVGQYRIECKRRAAIAVHEWLEQCMAASSTGDIPIVIARADAKEAIVILRLADFLPLMAAKVTP